MKIVIDEKIPYLHDALLQMGHSVIALPGDTIANEHLLDAGALFVRTRTRCNAALLNGTAVRFIGTATIGYDHIDADYCKESGIKWTNAPGCNADAVLQYVQSVIYAWARDNSASVAGLSLGIVGVGQIGSRVERWARSIGMNVILNDPPREERGEEGFSPLADVVERCDIITFHPTLSKVGRYASYHLADADFLGSLCRCRLLINASRGPIVDNKALLAVLEGGKLQSAAIDVWEGEPNLDLSLLQRAYIATPHIAGYSAEGKINATRQVLESFADFTGYSMQIPMATLQQPLNPIVEAATEGEALLAIYNPHDDTVALKESPERFEWLRNNYKLRREPSAYKIVYKR